MEPNTDNKPLLNENVQSNEQIHEQNGNRDSQNHQNNYPSLQQPPIPYETVQNYPQVQSQSTGQSQSPYSQQQQYAQPYGFNQGYQPPLNYSQEQPPQYLQTNQPVFTNQILPHPMYPPQGQVNLNFPNISPNHPYYQRISIQAGNACPRCFTKGTDIVNYTAGCSAVSWAVCLFCFTGILFCWVPFCVDDCKDIVIICSRCGAIKAVIQRDCC